MLFTITDVLNQVLSLSSSVVASKIMEKLNADLVPIITGLVLDQNRKFCKLFPAVADELKEKELKPVMSEQFRKLTADQLGQPLSVESVAKLFGQFFLKAKFREAESYESIDPKYRSELAKCAQDFISKFEERAIRSLQQNSAAATRIFVNSLARSLENQEKIIQLLQKVQQTKIEFPEELQKEILLPLQPILRNQIQAEFYRFREEWAFIYRVLKGETTPEEETEKEWLVYLNQVIEWKEFRITQRSRLKDISGELFEMEKSDDILGSTIMCICWGWPCESEPKDTELEIAIAKMKARKHSNAFIVSRHSLLDRQVQLLQQHEIKQTTLDNFVDSLLNIKKHKEIVIDEYEAQEIYKFYIQLNCHSRTNANEVLDLQNYFMEWVQSEKINHLALLGDFGTGKTEFCRRIQWQLLKNYKSKQPSRIPVLITLRDQKNLKLPQMLANIMNEMGLKKIDYPAFRTLNRMGRFVVLIDGFDEMDTHANAVEMKRNFQTLAILAEGKSKVFLTSRTHYFEHLAREIEVISSDFQTIYLNLYTRDQIRNYANKICASSPSARNVFNELEKFSQLEELMRTPVLLDMIIKIIPDLQEYEGKFNLALIYQKTVERWIRQAEREGRLEKLKSQEAVEFMQDLAWQMHNENRLQVPYTQLHSQTYQQFCKRLNIPDNVEIDAIFSEVRTCTFLNRDDDGNYKFAHKSFMEYFTARYLAARLENGQAPETVLNEEMRQFI